MAKTGRFAEQSVNGGAGLGSQFSNLVNRDDRRLKRGGMLNNH